MYKVVSRAGMVKINEANFASAGAQFFEAPLATEDDLIKFAHDADAIIAGSTEPYSRRVIQSLTRCKIISRWGIGCNNIDLKAATEYGILVAYVPDASVAEVSDHAMALLLCFARNLIPISQAVREGVWQPKSDTSALREPVVNTNGKTLGLVGLGRIGRALCRKAKAFGMRVIIYDPYISTALVNELGAESVNLNRLLTESDFVSLHAPLTEETKHLFGLEQFKQMKPTAYLINTARGGLIDEGALAIALSNGYIAGAGLDVTDPEPPKTDNPLLKMKNVIITAHTAYYSPASITELSRHAVDAVRAVLSGQWPRDLANPEVKQSENCRLKP